jgi:transcriptional regulator with XRE-family HTH domain
MLGEKLRFARSSLGLSLSEVAARAEISAATLSRIERDKQSLDLDLFLQLTKILKLAPSDCFDHNGDAPANDGADSIVHRLTVMDVRDRTAFWRQLSDEMAKLRRNGRIDIRAAAQQVDELLAQIDFLRNEIERVRKNLRRG